MRNIRRNIANIRYASRIIFAASKRYYILKLIFSFLSALIPYFPLFFWRELINNLTLFTADNLEPLIIRIWILAACYGITILLGKLMDTLSEYISYKYNDAVQYYLDNLMVDKVSSIDLAFYDSSDLRDKLSNSWALSFSIKRMVFVVFDMYQKTIRLVLSFALMMTLSHWLVPVVIILCIPTILGDKSTNKIDYEFQKEHTKSHRKLEYYKGLFSDEAKHEIRIYNLSNYLLLLYDKVWSGWDRAIREKDIKVCIINLASLLVLTISEIIVYVLSVFKLIAGEIGVGDVAYYVSLLTQFRSDFSSLFLRINRINKQSKEISDVRSFIEMKPLLEKGGTLIPPQNPLIEFDDVTFRYPNGDHDVLSHCSFSIRCNEKIGLVGLNGSGKSTIVKLLCRFYDPTAGRILIDGIENKEYDVVELRKLFGVLFQDYVKYSLSVRENVALSNLSRSQDIESIWKACEKSMASDFIKEWEKGMDENLTRRFDPCGKELSGGQWQRISLARAIFRDSPIVLLDEPSAALDPIAEHQIFEDFICATRDKSALLISHRLSSINICDKILLLENGRIVEQGSHEELIKRGGRYAYLFGLQASKYV